MITIEKIDTCCKAQLRRFIDLPVRLYANDSRWVQPLRKEVAETLRRDRHPSYQDSEADLFLAVRDGRDVERTVRASRFKYAPVTQIAETAVQMRRDLEELGAHPFKNHRVYGREAESGCVFWNRVA